MFHIEKNKLFTIINSIVLIFLILVAKMLCESNFKNDIETGLACCGLISILVFSFLFYTSNTLKKGLINVYSCILLMAFLFYYGQHLVILMGKADVLKTYYRSILDGRVPNIDRIGTGFIILIYMMMLNIGVVIGSCSKKRENKVHIEKELSNIDLYNQSIRNVAWIILAIVLVPTLYKYYLDVLNTLTYGYSEALSMTTESTIQKICYFLSYFFLPSIYILLISYSNSKKKNIIILIYFVYVGLYLMTGSRFRVFESVVAIILIFNCRIKQIKGKDLIRIILIGVFLIAAFSIIRESREVIANSDNAIDIISKTWEKISKEGLFTNVLIETGSTVEVIDVVLYKTPQIVPYSYGYSLFGAFVMILPTFLRGGFDINSVSTSMIYSPQYLNEIKIGMGSSFIAEAYHNFGPISYLFILLFGIIIGKLLTIFNNEYKTENNFELYKYVYISSLLCFAIRTDVVSIPRYYVYYVLLIQVLIKIVYDYTKTRIS